MSKPIYTLPKVVENYFLHYLCNIHTTEHTDRTEYGNQYNLFNKFWYWLDRECLLTNSEKTECKGKHPETLLSVWAPQLTIPTTGFDTVKRSKAGLAQSFNRGVVEMQAKIKAFQAQYSTQSREFFGIENIWNLSRDELCAEMKRRGIVTPFASDSLELYPVELPNYVKRMNEPRKRMVRHARQQQLLRIERMTEDVVPVHAVIPQVEEKATSLVAIELAEDDIDPDW